MTYETSHKTPIFLDYCNIYNNISSLKIQINIDNVQYIIHLIHKSSKHDD
jgi:hypothetical protein